MRACVCVDSHAGAPVVAGPGTPGPAPMAGTASGSRVLSPVQGGGSVPIPVIEPGRDGWRDLHRALVLIEEVGTLVPWNGGGGAV